MSGLIVGVGAELDLVTKTDFHAGLSELGERIARSVDRSPAHGETAVSYRRTVASELATAGQPLVLNFIDQPAEGRLWSIAAFVVVGSDDHTVLPGTSAVLAIGDPTAIPPGGTPPRGDILLPSNNNTVPNSVQFNREVGIAIAPSLPYACVYGAATGQSITAILYFWDRPLTDLGRIF